MVNIGYDMWNAYREGRPMPTVAEQTDQDDLTERSIKRIITYMTQFHTADRKNISEVEEELSGNYTESHL